jgi:hypothetical protein
VNVYFASNAVAMLLYEPAETAGPIGLQFLFSFVSNVAAFGEAEHVFGIDLTALLGVFAAIGRRRASGTEPQQ